MSSPSNSTSLFRAILYLPPLALLGSCSTESPVAASPGKTTFDLLSEAAGVTEVWLLVVVGDSSSDRQVRIIRDEDTVFVGGIESADSVVMDSGLTPNTTYLYKGQLLRSGIVIDSTQYIHITTLDTTDHIFQWQSYRLGIAGSFLNDVWVISETNIWAGGVLFLNDSSGQLDPIQYNAAFWNGQEWSIQRILFPFCDVHGNEVGTSPYEVTCIFSLGRDDVWLSDGGSLVYWDGAQFNRICLPPGLIKGAIKRLWASSPTNLYAVGLAGTIIHYNGVGWEGIESGTTLDINDIWGEQDSSTGKVKVVCVAANNQFDEGKDIIEIDGTVATFLPEDGLAWSLRSIWFSGQECFIAGAGIFETNFSLATWQAINGLTTYYSYSVRGQALNNVVVVGALGDVLHFNGLTWRRYTGLEIPELNGSYLSGSVSSQAVAAVGWDGDAAAILIGLRQ